MRRWLAGLAAFLREEWRLMWLDTWATEYRQSTAMTEDDPRVALTLARLAAARVTMEDVHGIKPLLSSSRPYTKEIDTDIRRLFAQRRTATRIRRVR